MSEGDKKESESIEKELGVLLGRSQIFTHAFAIQVAFHSNEDAIKFRNIIWAIRKDNR